MKVLHLNDHVERRGGVEVYLHALLSRLAKSGFQVILAHGDDGELAGVKTKKSVHLKSPLSSHENSAHRAVASLINDQKIDVVHVHSVYNRGALRACIDNAPTVLHLHDYRYICPASTFYQRRLRRRCNRTCGLACFAIGPLAGCQTPRLPYAVGFYRRVRFVQQNAHRFSAILANSNHVKDRFVAGASGSSNVEVLHYFTEADAVADSPPDSAEIGRVNKSVVREALFVGRVRYDKGIFDFIRAIARLKDIRGRIVGVTQEAARSAITREANRAGCADRVIVDGWMESRQVAREMRRTGVVVFPSLWDEPFGLVGVEAMKQGTPVVAYDVGGVRDWLRDGENGYLVDPGNIAGLAERIGAVIDDPEMRRRLGEAGRSFVEANFGPERHMARILEVYQSTFDRCGPLDA